MNNDKNDKKVTIGEGGLTPPGKGVATMRDAGTPGRRDAGTPGRRDAGTPGRPSCLLPLASSGVLCLPARRFRLCRLAGACPHEGGNCRPAASSSSRRLLTGAAVPVGTRALRSA